MKIRETINGKPGWSILIVILIGLGGWLLVNVSNNPKVYAEKSMVQNIAQEMRQGFKDVNEKIDKKQEILNKKIDKNQTNLHKKIDAYQSKLIDVILKSKK